MRIRISEHIAGQAHRYALLQGRSDQEMIDRILALGIRALSTPAAPSVDGECVLLPEPKYREIKALGERQGIKNGHEMIRRVIDAGLVELKRTTQ